jgi:hypothetical protein
MLVHCTTVRMEICQRLRIFSIHDVSTVVCTPLFQVLRFHYTDTIIQPAVYANRKEFLTQRKTPPTNTTRHARFTYKFDIAPSQVTYKFHISILPCIFSVRLLAFRSFTTTESQREKTGTENEEEKTVCSLAHRHFDSLHMQSTKWMNRFAQCGWDLQRTSFMMNWKRSRRRPF